MAAAHQLIFGWAAIHAAWLCYWLCGSLVLPPSRDPQARSAALADFVLTSAAGISLVAGLTFVLGLLHALYPVAAVGVAVLLGVAFALRGDSPLRAPFWQIRFAQVRNAATPGALIVWMGALFLSVPALFPDSGSDGTAFYLPQALEYARSHGLVVDPWFRYPWYPNNWPITLAWPLALGAIQVIGFFNWLASALAMLGVYALVTYSAAGAGAREARASLVGLGAVLTLALVPMFVRFGVLNMIDIPSGMLYLMCTLACVVAVRERTSRTIWALVACAAFVVGLKVSFPALIPLFVAFLLLALRAARIPWKRSIAVLAAFFVLASPWYVRSWVLSGDPFEPVLNLRFQGADPKISQDDLTAQIEDLAGDKRPLSLLMQPYRMFVDPGGRESRDIGVTLLCVLLPLPAMYLAWVLLSGRRTPRPLPIVALAIVYAYAYWQLTSHLERYALLFLPLLSAFAGMIAATLTVRVRALTLPAFAILLVLSIPSPSAFIVFGQIWETAYQNVGIYYTTRNLWLEYRTPAYPQLQDLAHWLRRVHATDKRVYIVELGGDTFIADQLGITTLGDAFGLGRYKDIGRAVAYGRVPQWLARYDVVAVVGAQSQLLADPKYAGFAETLVPLGWRRMRYANNDWVVFTSPALPPLTIGEGHPASEGPEGKAAPATDSPAPLAIP